MAAMHVRKEGSHAFGRKVLCDRRRFGPMALGRRVNVRQHASVDAGPTFDGRIRQTSEGSEVSGMVHKAAGQIDIRVIGDDKALAVQTG